MIVRICTEDKNHERVRELCAKRFDAFTIFHGMGCWKGNLEPSLTIEIAVLASRNPSNRLLANEEAQRDAWALAHAIKELNQQEAVLIEYIESTNTLV